jgi:hypothetical protein
MIKAVRNGPMRAVEMKIVNVAMAAQTLTAMSAAHPSAVCGLSQFRVTSAATANMTVDDTSEF